MAELVRIVKAPLNSDISAWNKTSYFYYALNSYGLNYCKLYKLTEQRNHIKKIFEPSSSRKYLFLIMNLLSKSRNKLFKP